MLAAPSANTVTIVAFVAFWPLATGAIYLAGRRWAAVRGHWQGMVAQWRPALAITLIFAASLVVGQGPSLNSALSALLMSPAVLCQALVGLALARSIAKYEPLPVTRSITRREHVVRTLGLALLIALLVVPATILVSILGSIIGQALLGEHIPASSGASFFPGNKWLTFFSLLAGAGIFEEVLFRLVILSLVWRLTGRRWLAIVLSALAFGAYHLSPLDSFYLTFWHYPVTQFLTSALSGLVLGYVYTRRGFETAVLGHTLSNWLPLMLSS